MFWDYGISGICPVSSIVKDYVLKTVSVSILRCKGWEALTHLGPLERVNLSSLDLSNPECNTPTMTKVSACDNMSKFRFDG
jgi:hypothetical protein